MKKKIYLAGKITDDPEYKVKFLKKETHFLNNNYIVINPIILPEGLAHQEYMHICFPMIDVVDEVYFFKDWTSSKGAKAEHDYAISKGKKITHEVN